MNLWETAGALCGARKLADLIYLMDSKHPAYVTLRQDPKVKAYYNRHRGWDGAACSAYCPDAQSVDGGAARASRKRAAFTDKKNMDESGGEAAAAANAPRKKRTAPAAASSTGPTHKKNKK